MKVMHEGRVQERLARLVRTDGKNAWHGLRSRGSLCAIFRQEENAKTGKIALAIFAQRGQK